MRDSDKLEYIRQHVEAWKYGEEKPAKSLNNINKILEERNDSYNCWGMKI